MVETGQGTGKVFSVEEAAVLLHMTPEQVVNLIEADILPAIEINGVVLVPEEALAVHPHGSCEPGCAGRPFCGAGEL